MSAVLTDNLPLLAGAPNGIKKLRELILELAVRGKLVPQDPSDEPASELLKRIAEEKARLVAEGKINKQKLLAAITEEEIPYDLPDTWACVRLPEVYYLVSVSGNKLLSSQISEKGIFPVVDQGKRFVAGYTDDESLLIRLPGPVVVFGDHTTERKYVDFDFVAGADGVKILRPVLLNEKFFWWHLVGLKLEARGYARHFKVLNDAFFALPPKAEQSRIVAKVDELMALCDRLEARQGDADSAHAQLVQALLNSLTQSRDAGDFAQSWQRLAEHFHTLFITESSIDALTQTLLQLAVMGKLVPQDPGDEPARELCKRIDVAKQRVLIETKARKQKELAVDTLSVLPYSVPNGWEWKTLDSVLYVTGGVTLGRKLAGRKLVIKPYLRVANVQRGHLVLDQIKEVEIPEDELEKYLLSNGDLLITEGGDWDKVGRTAIWRGEISECLHQNHVFRARAVTTEWEPRWAEIYLNSATAREYFAGSSKQTTNLASINMAQLRACAFPLPPLAEQYRIVAKVDQLMALCDQLKARLNQARQVHEHLASALVEQAVA
ncbi:MULTISPECIES: restriction endonuclease subunit S [Pseudomonas]|nr:MULTISPECIES: restriction endonuclease subunit S [Pseudomonas]MDZ3995316.1 hypothetical protein [Pseudomonas sp. Teo4]